MEAKNDYLLSVFFLHDHSDGVIGAVLVLGGRTYRSVKTMESYQQK